MGASASQVSQSLPFDNSTNGFVADNAQEAIEEAGNQAISSIEKILSTESFTIPVRRQMITHGLLINEGLLIIQGAFVGIGT